jgi:hypothetical protein
MSRTTNPMTNANRFKLGLFSINADGGTAFTKVANRWRADWSAIEILAQIADAAGFEFLLPSRAGRVMAVRRACEARRSRRLLMPPRSPPLPGILQSSQPSTFPWFIQYSRPKR